MLYFSLLYFVIGCAITVTGSEECSESDLHFESSQCDEHDRRWVYKVPDSTKHCKLTSTSIPKLIEGCERACPAGTYLNIETQECTTCPQGTFSAGDAIDYLHWTEIPTEFSVDKTYDVNRNDHCTGSSWYPKGEYLLGKAATGCAVTLSMHLNNLKSGQVSFTYSIEDYNTMAFFTTRNAHCSQVPGTSFLLQHTGHHVYLNVTVTIPKGNNVLQWYLFTENNAFRSLFGSPDSLIKIARIRITGTPPIWRCTDCPPGTYNEHPGSASCTTCPPNTYSSAQSSACVPCQPTEYSEPGSSKCTVRAPCTANDYMSFWSECDAEGKRHKRWKWIEPKICNSQTGVALPPDEAPIACDSCPLGTMLTEHNRCELCSVDQKPRSSIDLTCVICDANHVPVFGAIYSTWSYFPPFIQTNCQNAFGSACAPWTLDSNFISSGIGLPSGAVSDLTLIVPHGFVRSDELVMNTWWQVTFVPPIPETFISVEFEMLCHFKCELQFKQRQIEREETILRTWTGSISRRNYTLYIKDSRPANFTWTFRKAETVRTPYDHDHVRIYRIQVTNAVGMGVIGCRKCLKGMKDGKCVKCPQGLFYEELTNASTHQTVTNCTKCPSNHIVIADPTVARSVAEACVPCEPGTKAINNTICVLDTAPYTPNGIQYNLTQFLSKQHRFNGTRMFTPSGNRYSHEFRLSLAYGNTTECVEQMSVLSPQKVTAMICRHTCVWTSTNPERTIFTKPISLADRMITAVPSNISEAFWAEINTNLTRAGWTKDVTGTDLHYIFETNDITPTCPHGRRAVVTFRCGIGLDYDYIDPRRTVELNSPTSGTLEVPPLCPDGTCDGCLYQFLWTGILACPICQRNDFRRIVGECHMGKRTIYWTGTKGCRIAAGTLLMEVESCPMVTKGQLAAIIVTIFIMCCLSLVILVCYRRNKRLEYKYMKLIQSTEGKTQQPTSCALDEPDEDNVDSFSRRAIRSDGTANLGLELEPTALATIRSFPKVQLPRVGPIVYKSKSDSDAECLPENEIVS